MPTSLIVDADSFAYHLAARHEETFDFGDDLVSRTVAELDSVLPSLQREFDGLMQRLDGDRLIVALSCASRDCWRVDVLPTYKANRSQVKPELLAGIKQFMRDTYKTFERPRMEADDICGILATHPTLVPGKKIVISIDKDMKTIPGWLFNPSKDTKPKYYCEVAADYWHLYQTLTGDTVDGYRGCPGIGPVKAEALLLMGAEWGVVVQAFKSKGLTEADALVQARVARICRHTDYDFKAKRVKLWSPTI